MGEAPIFPLYSVYAEKGFSCKLGEKNKIQETETILQSVIFEYFEIIFSPNLQEKSLSAYSEYTRNDCSFPNIGPVKFFSQEIVIRHN